MPSTKKLRSRLVEKLSELFQLDQPDLDFGFYRIMHAKANEVQGFIDKDMLNIVEDAFREIDENHKRSLRAEIEKEIYVAGEYGATDPENSPKVKQAKAAYKEAEDTASAEADVYDHLYRFFNRYYDDGDFLSLRRHTRETSGKAASYAIPYCGEEVKMHWANADQYYIKTTEYFPIFTFDLMKCKEVNEAEKPGLLDDLRGVENDLLAKFRVNFHIIKATEGDHGNIKAGKSTQRFFYLHADNPVTFNDDDELVINFEFRSDLKKKKGRGLSRDKRNEIIVEEILMHLQGMSAKNGSRRKRFTEYLRLLKTQARTPKDGGRSVLTKFVNRYTARNTMDYFIHKDLGTFLHRELDFYIKNEVIHLDDIENAEPPIVDKFLMKIGVLRKIAGKLIDFLAQLEDFQKKLWLKKKFITETNYCITLDRIPENIYPEVAANESQCQEWVEMFAINENIDDFGNPGFSQPLSIDFLKANSNLVLDTRFFDENFKDRLVASIDNFDEVCNGLLIHSENFQALNLLKHKYQNQAGCIYIDPPYNSPNSEILYKNSYRHSSWLTLMQDRLVAAKKLQGDQCSVVVAIDENEGNGLQRLMYEIFEGWDVALISIESNKKGVQGDHFSYSGDFAIFAIPSKLKKLNKTPLPKSEWEYSNLRNWGNESLRTDAQNCFYPIYVRKNKIIRFGAVSDDGFHPSRPNITEPDGTTAIYPIDHDGVERKWRYARDTVENIQQLLRVETTKTGDLKIMKAKSHAQFKTIWYGSKFNSGDSGTKVLSSMGFKHGMFDYPKSIHTVRDCIFSVSKPDALIIDYFAGSGTTGHSVINLNREDGGNRKYILVELGDYFDTVLKRRIEKVIYSEAWKKGKPTTNNTGISHCFKYIRLESYEDTLNNLCMEKSANFQSAISANPQVKEDYMLHYMLDVEARGSQSLLNINAFADPTAYTLNVKKPGSDQHVTRAVDLIETFNFLIGLRVMHTSVPQMLQAQFKNVTDPELPKLPKKKNRKLVIDGCVQKSANGSWWFRKIEGWVPKNPNDPSNGLGEKVLIIWRKLTDNIEKDNLMLNQWFKKNCLSSRDFKFNTIFVNGTNNLLALRGDDMIWKVRLTEEEFMKRMWETDYS